MRGKTTSMRLAWNALAVDSGAERIEREGLLRNVQRLAGVGQAEGVQQPVEMLAQVVCAMIGDDLRSDLHLKREVLAMLRDVEAVDQLLRRSCRRLPVEGHENRVQPRQGPGVLQERVCAGNSKHSGGILLGVQGKGTS